MAARALEKMNIGLFEKVNLVTGLPYEIGKEDRQEIKKLLKDNLNLKEIAVYPQSIGSLYDLDLQSATVINIGHGTTEIVVIEKLNQLYGVSEPLASDYILTSLSNYIQSAYGFKPSTDNLVSLVSGKIDEIITYNKSVHREGIKDQLQTAVSHLIDKICYNVRYILSQLTPNLECSKRIVLSGGGSLIKGLKDSTEQQLNCKVIQPSNPIFSNVYGFYKMGKKLYG